jgi:purine-binding chemotaxis protein CheW
VTTSKKDDDTIQLIGFYVGPKLYGTDILAVREILRNPTIEPVDQGPDFMQGCIRLRGDIIPILDLGFFLKQEMDQADSRKWLLVHQPGEQPTGYLVDSVTKIIRIRKEMILPVSEIILSSLRNRYILGVCDTDKGLLVVLDLGQMLMQDEKKAIRQTKFNN